MSLSANEQRFYLALTALAATLARFGVPLEEADELLTAIREPFETAVGSQS